MTKLFEIHCPKCSSRQWIKFGDVCTSCLNHKFTPESAAGTESSERKKSFFDDVLGGL